MRSIRRKTLFSIVLTLVIVVAGLSQEVTSDRSRAVWSVGFSPDGKLIASGSGANTVKIWDAANCKELRALRTHTDEVWSVAFSPDGKMIASGSVDHTVKLWDSATGELLRSLTRRRVASNLPAGFPAVAYRPEWKNDCHRQQRHEG